MAGDEHYWLDMPLKFLLTCGWLLSQHGTSKSESVDVMYLYKTRDLYSVLGAIRKNFKAKNFKDVKPIIENLCYFISHQPLLLW